MERNDVIVMLCIGLGLPVLVCILSSRGHRHGMDRGEHVHPDHLPEGVIDNSADPVSAGEGESVRQFAASIPPSGRPSLFLFTYWNCLHSLPLPAADLRPFADGSAVRTSMVAGGG